MTGASSVRSLAEAFQATASCDPSGIALRTIDDRVGMTWQEYADRVGKLAAGLAGLGVRRGDTVALMMANRPEFYPIDTAVFHLGATPFSIYNTSSAEQVAFLLANAAARVAVVDAEFVPVVAQARGHTALEHIICVDDDPPAGALSLAELEKHAAPGFDFEATWRAVGPEDVLTLIYTSGTTGDPKGVQITHRNMLAEVAATNDVLRAGPGDRIISFLPSAHIADRWAAHYLQVICGTTVTPLADRRDLMLALVSVRPTLFGAVPQLWQKIRAGVDAMVAGQPDGVRQAMEEAFRLGRERVRAGQLGTVPAEIAAGCASAEESTFRPLRERLGLDQARIVLSGAAAIPVDVVEFFNALGVPLTDGWGMSELTCMAAITPVGELRLGTVGRAIRGVEIVLADDGELLVRGPTVMRGYLGRPDLTAEAIDPEGWMHTGDIGEIDADGYIRVIDRKKELIINSSGKNMSPANIEGAVKACSSMIAQVVAIGDDRPFNVALVVLDPDAAAQFAEARGRASDAASLAADADVLALVQDAVDRANARLSRVEQIKRFMVLPTFWEPGSDILTHTMKLRRRPIAARYAREIEQLYAGVEPRPLTTAG